MEQKLEQTPSQERMARELLKDFGKLIVEMDIPENQRGYLTPFMWAEVLESTKSKMEQIYNQVFEIGKENPNICIELGLMRSNFDSIHLGLCYYFASHKCGWGLKHPRV